MQRTYVVTGCASGTGAATAELLRQRGYRVIGVDIMHAEAIADLSTPSGRLAAAEDVLDQSDGDVDAVIACAAIAAAKPITVSTNFFGVTQFIEALLEPLTLRPTPRVVVVTSISALHEVDELLVGHLLEGHESAALKRGQQLTEAGHGHLNFSSSKFALGQWVRREATQDHWAAAGIALNAVAPGTILTHSMKRLLESPDQRSFIDSHVPMPFGYHLEPSAVARTLMWLTDANNFHVTGQTIFIDGGAETLLRPARTF
jgi:NAD(P)-dependent dehydrogenase (short-subunit alcohol dehydrogenase family)